MDYAYFLWQAGKLGTDGWNYERKELLQQLVTQLASYFEGTSETFDLPVLLQGTDFQKRVWQALSEIPYGVVVSYKDIAISAGVQKLFKR